MNLTASQSTIKEAKCFVGDSIETRAARIAIYGVIIILSLVANSLVIAIVCRTKEMKKPINFFITNMCCSDLLITILYMPRVLAIFAVGYEWLLDGTLGLVTCKMVPFLMETAISVSILTVVVISGDRLLAVCFPLRKFMTKKASQVILIVIWVTALTFRFPVLFIELREQNGKQYCNLKLDESFNNGAEKAYYKVIMIAIYVVPVLVTIICYVALIIAIKRFKPPGRLSGRATNSREIKNRNLLKLVVIVITCFISCWFLYSVIFVLDAYNVFIPCELRFARLVLAHANSAITPCLYFIFSENYRDGLRNSFKMRNSSLCGQHGQNAIELDSFKEFRTSRRTSNLVQVLATNRLLQLKK